MRRAGGQAMHPTGSGGATSSSRCSHDLVSPVVHRSCKSCAQTDRPGGGGGGQGLALIFIPMGGGPLPPGPPPPLPWTPSPPPLDPLPPSPGPPPPLPLPLKQVPGGGGGAGSARLSPGPASDGAVQSNAALKSERGTVPVVARGMPV